MHEKIVLAHGSGGKLSHDLIKEIFLPAFGNQYLNRLDDQAIFQLGNCRIAFTTDSYVVDPIFFPGGDIGKLAVNGTINDLSVGGAESLFLSASLIIEEGFSMESLKRIVLSMKEAADFAGVKIVTGDTKVVQAGGADKIFINTSGIGIIKDSKIDISARNAKPGDIVILSGSIGDHGIAVLSSRKDLSIESDLISDTFPLNRLVSKMLTASNGIHCMRDPTRGGVSSTLNEIAEQSEIGIEIDEIKIPVKEEVQGVCEILGLDPLYIANEGKLIAIVSREASGPIFQVMKNTEEGRDAIIIGEVVENHPGIVLMKTLTGGMRVIDMPVGEQLPRIC